MKQTTALQQRILQFDDDAMAALTILSDPACYERLALEWAQATANRLIAACPGRYLALAHVSARVYSQLAFHECGSLRNDPSESETDIY